jgi:hypothetical protein
VEVALLKEAQDRQIQHDDRVYRSDIATARFRSRDRRVRA